MSTPPVVETSALCRSFADRDAVVDLELAIDRGEIFGLLGPNGAGKTTTIRMLTTLLAPTSGRAKVGGYDVVREAGKVRGTIGYVMQRVPARWNMTGREILEIEAALYRVPRKELRARVEHALAVTDLAGDADRLFQHYSGGMQKRLDIACALVHRPRLLVLDEPTLGLDVQSRHHVWGQVRALRDEGITVLLATNYLDEADRLCDRLMIIDRGRTVVTGSPEELKRQVGFDVLKVSTDRPAAAMTAIRAQGWARRVVGGDGCVHVHVRDASLLLPEVLKVSAAAGAVVTKVTYTRPSLDDVFLMHTGRELLIGQGS
jgi:ABC-2 type transport system ATP-binding protein